jgi:hypothetical protein
MKTPPINETTNNSFDPQSEGRNQPSLYQFNRLIEDALESVIDEDGQIKDEQAIEILESLQMAQKDKAINIAVWIKQLETEARLIKEEESRMKQRREVRMKKIDSLKAYLAYSVEGQKFFDPRAEISWRKSTRVEIDNEEIIPDAFFDVKVVRNPNKKMLKEHLSKGPFEGARLTEHLSIVIK